MEVLSEHMCQGWLEGYLLTGRHGFFSCYEAFIHIVDSMFNQHAKWLKVTLPHSLAPAHRVAELSADFARLAAGSQRLQPSGPRLHRSRGEQKGRVVRVYLPPDANTLLSVTDHCLRSRQLRQRDRGRQAACAAVARHGSAIEHCTAGIGIWEWASTDDGVRAGCGDGLLRRRSHARNAGRRGLLREHLPDLKIRVVNVVDLMTLQPATRASARLAGRGIRFAVHRATSRWSSPSTAIRG